jgi:hypothetical protein
MRPTSLLDDAARRKGTSDVACPVWPLATRNSKLTARRLVITFVPTTSRKLECREGAIVRHIILHRNGEQPMATGGELTLEMPWKLDPGRLQPIAYGRRFKSCQPTVPLPAEMAPGDPSGGPSLARGFGRRWRPQHDRRQPRDLDYQRRGSRFLTRDEIEVVGSVPMLHPEAQTVHEMLEDQPHDSGGSSCHILAVWQMRSATASMDARALSPALGPPCEIGKMNRPLFPHCQIAEKSSRLRGRKMTSVRASLSTTSSQ